MIKVLFYGIIITVRDFFEFLNSYVNYFKTGKTKEMKKIYVFIIIAAAALVLYSGSRVYLMNCSCKTEPFKTEMFTDEEINEAIRVAATEAERSFEICGCNILKVYYAGDENAFPGNDNIKAKVIVYTDFYAGFNTPVEINRNYIERDWKYTLEKNDDGGWKIVNRGRC